jgi:hypothetical protein
MRVCQFRHYGTVFYAPQRGPEHANRELLVLQTATPLSIGGTLSAHCRQAFWMHEKRPSNETSLEK